MSKPYMCGDDLPVYIPTGDCECNYTIEKEVDENETIYKLVSNGEQQGFDISVPNDANYTIESQESSSGRTFYNLTKGGTPVGDTIVVSPQPYDYVVEQGVDGIWTYRKWESGIAECWGRYQGTVNITIQWGGCYYSNPYIQDFPTDFFIDVPVVQVLNSSGGSSMVMGGSLITKDSFNIQHVRGTQVTGAGVNNGYYAIGKWK